MQVILLKDVPKVGRKFEVVDVSDGYAANFLLPKRLAETATPSRVAELAKRKESAKAAEDARRADIEERITTLKGETITLTAKADEQGHLYKKIHADDIVTVLADEYELTVDEESVLLDAPITTLGEHTVPLEVMGISCDLTVSVVAG
jgi:large subunit ribosomal protein L9